MYAFWSVNISLDHIRAKVQDSRVEKFPWGLSVIPEGSFLCIHKFYRDGHIGV